MKIPMKYTARFINGAAFKPSDWGDHGKPIIRIAQLTGGEFDNFFNGSVDPRYGIEDGDLLFSWSATLDSFEWSRGSALLNQHIFKVIPGAGTHQRFLYYSLKHHAPLWADVDAHGSTMRHIKKESLGNKIWLSDLKTQKAIADFLDRETARIDQLIEKKQRFLAVLNQKWAATVTLTLTNGLQPNAPRRDSGISWIGEIPAHWEVLKLGHIGRCANGINISGEAFGSGFPFVSYSDVYKNSELPMVVSGLVQSTPEDRARYALRAGDVLFTRTSETIDEIGFSSVCMQDMPNSVYAGFLIRFRPREGKLLPLFSRFLFRNEALRAFFAKEMMIVTRASLSQNLLQKMPVVLPPLPEQERMSAHLQAKEKTHASIFENTQKSIDRLREYRSALITAAVTGQIDVATWGKGGETDRRLDKIEEDMTTGRNADDGEPMEARA